jgi:hypothetical protein
MVNTTIALKPETYQRLLKAKHHLEQETGKSKSFSNAVDFLFQSWSTKRNEKDESKNKE